MAFFPKEQAGGDQAFFACCHGGRVPADGVWLAIPPASASGPGFASGTPAMQDTVLDPLDSSSFNIYYFMGMDGISFPLVMLTSFLSMLAMGASWQIDKHVKAYCILFLLLETGMLGVFLALDFFLFYVFWEVMLLPMYFLIGVWGGPRREYAAIKFFLYTLLGSVLMLIAILMLYFNSDLRLLSPQQLVDAKSSMRPPPRTSAADIDASRRHCRQHTFNILALAADGPSTTRPVRRTNLLWGKSPAVVGVPAAVHRLYHQGAGGAGAYLAARRPRRGARRRSR